MIFTDSGIVTEQRDEQERKAYVHIFSQPNGMRTFSSDTQRLNAERAIVFTGALNSALFRLGLL